jgi:nucleoside-diphosphate-sugar epimerase
MTTPPLPLEDIAHVLAHTRPLWAGARGARFFITGGTGFFGRWLLESFAHANDVLGLRMNAVVLTRDPVAFRLKSPHLASRPDLVLWQGDVREFSFPPGFFDFVIHGAAEAGTGFAAQDERDILDVLIGGTRRVLDFAATAKAKRVLFISSGAVYGTQPAGLTHVRETHAGSPDTMAVGSSYGEGKRVAEVMCADHARRTGCGVTVARCFGFIGPGLPLDAHLAAGNFIRDAAEGGPIRVKGDGSPHRSYLYAADLAVWLWTILFAGKSGTAYNVGSDVDTTIRSLANAVVSAINPGCCITVEKEGGLIMSPNRYVPDIDRAKNELGLFVSVGLRDALIKTHRWHAGQVTQHV